MKSYVTADGVRVVDDAHGGLLWSFQGHQPRELAAAGLAMAREHPDRTWMGMETDCGGVQLLECPMSIVGADADALVTLLGDLARVCWGRGFRRDDRSWHCDDQIGWARVPDLAEGGVRLKEDLPRFGIDAQVEAVLRGDSKRLDLPEGFRFK